jgi:type II secretory pathway component GspD/PulD (secretin)
MVRTTRRFARTAIGLTVLLLLATAGRAQQLPDRPMPARAREALRYAIQLYQQGEYDTAAPYFAYAHVGMQNLSSIDQKDLNTYESQNTSALQGRREGSMQLYQVEEALKQGKLADANRLLNVLDGNQYLIAAERQRVNELVRYMQAQSAQLAQQGKTDARTLMSDARTALQKGDLRMAEALAGQAEKVSSGLPYFLQPWSDSPAKLRRDIETARSKQAAPAQVKNDTGESSWMPNMRGWFGLDSKPAAAPDATPRNPESPADPKTASVTSRFSSLWPFGSSTPPAKDAAADVVPPDEKASEKARQLIRDGYKAVAMNELERARQCVAQAGELRVNYAAGEATPESLAQEIQRKATIIRLQSTAPVTLPMQLPGEMPAPNSNLPLNLNPQPGAAPAVNASPGMNAMPGVNANPGNSANPMFEPAMPFNTGPVPTPDRGMVPNLPPTQGPMVMQPAPNPNALPGNPMLNPGAVPNYLPVAQAPNTGQPKPKADARALLREGRALLQQKNFDDADKVCTQALNAGAHWGLFEDTPEKLRRDIHRTRQVWEREEAARLMVEGRKLFTQGSLDDAERKAYRAQQLHGPYGVFEFGDRPQKLIEDIHKARLSKAKDQPRPANPGENNPNILPAGGVPPTNPQNPPNKTSALPPPVPAGIMNASKNQAVALLREARVLESRGLLNEAWQKGQEARALQASFVPEEDSPDKLIASLRATRETQIQTSLQQVTELVNGSDNPQRFGMALTQLVATRNLALDFGMDYARVDQKAQWVQQIAAGSTNPNPPATAGMAPAPGDPGGVQTLDPDLQEGREKLQHALNELAADNPAGARRIAEQLFNPKYKLHAEAQRLMHSIDAVEYSRGVIEAKRNFETGMDAFLAKKYSQALAIFQQINPQFLPQQYAGRLRDVMATREMQPPPVRSAGVKENRPLKGSPLLGQGGASYPGQPDSHPEEDDPLDNQKKLDIIQRDALNQRGREAQRVALELFKNGDEKQAIETLNQYLQQVQIAQLSPDMTAGLRREAEQRIQQFKQVMSQKELSKMEKDRRGEYLKHDEGEYQRRKQKREQEMAVLMKEAGELYKQNKLKEAEVIARKVLEIDPENLAANALKRQAMIKRNQKTYDDDTHHNEDVFLNNLRTTVGDVPEGNNPFVLDRERMQIASQRGNGNIRYQNLNPRERAIEARLQRPISFHFKNTPLRDVIDTLRMESGVQIVADTKALQNAGISLEATLTQTLEDISMRAALNVLLKQVGLTYYIDHEVLMITTEGGDTRNRFQRITYPIADLVILPENHPMPDVFDLTKSIARNITPPISPYQLLQPPPFSSNNGVPVGSSSQGLGGSNYPGSANGYPPGNLSGPPTPPSPGQVADKLMELVKGAVAADTWRDVGGQGTIQYFPMGMALVINQAPEVQEEVKQLLDSLRKLQDLQVAVELRAVLVSETFFERIGVDFNMNITTPTSQTETNLVAGNFAPAGFVNRTGAGLKLVSGLTPAGTLTPDLNIPIRNNTFQFTTPQFGGYQPEAGLSLGLAFLNDIQVFLFLEAVQGDRRAHVMQAPKITVYNGQFATIGAFVSRPQVTGVTPAALPNFQPIMIPTVNVINFGLGMSVQPVVSPDRRFVRLNLTPQLAAPMTDPAGAIVTAVPQNFVGNFDGGVAQPAFANSPVNVTINPLPVNLIIANTTVNVPDGGTVLLGGFKFLAEERTEYGPPILSKIPYLSRLFRNVGWSRDGSTLMYLVTARIIMVEEEEQIFLGNIPPIPR